MQPIAALASSCDRQHTFAAVYACHGTPPILYHNYTTFGISLSNACDLSFSIQLLDNAIGQCKLHLFTSNFTLHNSKFVRYVSRCCVFPGGNFACFRPLYFFRYIGGTCLRLSNLIPNFEITRCFGSTKDRRHSRCRITISAHRQRWFRDHSKANWVRTVAIALRKQIDGCVLRPTHPLVQIMGARGHRQLRSVYPKALSMASWYDFHS